MFTIADNDNFTAHVEVREEIPFLHVDIYKWTKSSMQEMQILFDAVVEKCEEHGATELAFYGPEASVKLAKSFAPLDFVQEMDNGYYVGYWEV